MFRTLVAARIVDCGLNPDRKHIEFLGMRVK